MITAFGKALRKIRIDKGEVLIDMATRLEVSSSFISALETGKKNIPAEFIEKVIHSYSLGDRDADTLKTAAKDSITAIKIGLSKADQPQREAALIFARDFNNLTDETAEQIIRLLKNKTKEG